MTASFRDGNLLPRSVRFAEYSSSLGTQSELEIDPATRIAVLGTSAYPNKLVQRLRLVADGVELAGEYEHSEPGVGFVLAGGYLYTAFGSELDPENGARLRRLPRVSAEYGLVAKESRHDRLLLLQYANTGQSPAPWPLQVFDRRTFGRIATITVPIEGRADGLTLLCF